MGQEARGRHQADDVGHRQGELSLLRGPPEPRAGVLSRLLVAEVLHAQHKVNHTNIYRNCIRQQVRCRPNTGVLSRHVFHGPPKPCMHHGPLQRRRQKVCTMVPLGVVAAPRSQLTMNTVVESHATCNPLYPSWVKHCSRHNFTSTSRQVAVLVPITSFSGNPLSPISRQGFQRQPALIVLASHATRIRMHI